MADDDELRMPEESLSTIVVQFTKAELERIRRAVARLRADGQSEEAVRALMKRNLSRFDGHTLDLLYRRSLGETVADDIPAGRIVKEDELKKNTIRVEVSEPIPGLALNGLVQLRGEEWFLQRIEGKRYVLKKVV